MIWNLNSLRPSSHFSFPFSLSRQRFISPEKAHKINIEFASGLAIFCSARRFRGGWKKNIFTHNISSKSSRHISSQIKVGSRWMISGHRRRRWWRVRVRLSKLTPALAFLRGLLCVWTSSSKSSLAAHFLSCRIWLSIDITCLTLIVEDSAKIVLPSSLLSLSHKWRHIITFISNIKTCVYCA